MTTSIRYSLACLLTLTLAGCGGSSSSGSDAIASTGTTNSVPTRATFYDVDGVAVSRMQVEYPDELTINVQLESVGTDKIWGTEDDTSRLYLQCAYMFAPTPLLRYPNLFFLSMARSATGSLGLAMLGIPEDGPMKCPVRDGRRLQQESGSLHGLYVTGPSSDVTRYLINAELEDFGGTATEVLNYEFAELDMTVAEVLDEAEFTSSLDLSVVDEPDLPVIVDHTQVSTVTYDAEHRPLSIDLAADSSWTAVLDEYCIDADPTVVSIKLLRGCSAARQSRSYRYLDDAVEEDIRRYNGSSPSYIITYTTQRLADSVLLHPGSADEGATSGSWYRSYPLNASGQVTARVERRYGEDRVWGTEDDRHQPIYTYAYDSKGRLSEFRDGYSPDFFEAYDYDRNGRLKQVDKYFGGYVSPWSRTRLRYRNGALTRITVQLREGDPEGPHELKTRMVMEFSPSDESLPPLVLWPSVLPEAPPTIDELMQFQPYR